MIRQAQNAPAAAGAGGGLLRCSLHSADHGMGCAFVAGGCCTTACCAVAGAGDDAAMRCQE